MEDRKSREILNKKKRFSLNVIELNRHTLAVLFLGFASGLPIVLISSTLQAWYTSVGVNLMTIGMLTLVGQPYVYKFLWAPLFDRFNPIPTLGRRRSWILLMQIGLVIGIAIMAFLNPKFNPFLLAVVAFIVSICSASQDIAIDAYRTDLLQEKERGWGAALTTVGYRCAMLVAGALALILADRMGWRNTYLFMAGLMLIEMFITLWTPKPQDSIIKPSNLYQAIALPLADFIKRKHAVIIILFLISYKLCDAFALALNTTFLLRGVGFSLTELGLITKTVGLTAAILGSVAGGALLSRLGLYQSLLYFGILQLISNLPFALLSYVGHNYFLMSTTVFFEYFCGSLSNVSLIVFLMCLCNKRYTATQFAIFSAITSIGRVFAGPVAAILVEKLGWTLFYLVTGLIGLPPIILLVVFLKEMLLNQDSMDIKVLSVS